MKNMSESNKRIGQMKKNYPDFGLKRLFGGMAGAAWAMLMLLGMLLLPSQAMAADKDGTVSVPYYVTNISAFEWLIEKDDSILPSSLPFAVAKFTRTISKQTASVAFTYDDTDPTNKSLWKVKGDEPFPKGATFSEFKSNIIVSVSGTNVTFSYSIAESAVIRLKSAYNTTELQFQHDAMPPMEGINGLDFIKYVDLYASKGMSTFTHEGIRNTGSLITNITRLNRVEWESSRVLFVETNWYYVTLENIVLDADYDPDFPTETYWIL